MISPPLTTTATVAAHTQVSQTLCHFVLQPAVSFDFTAGQFIMLAAAIRGNLVERPYSIANAPRANGQLEFVVRVNLEGAMTPFLHALQPGQEVSIKGPYGRFGELSIQNPEEIVLIAGGAGISPIRSLMQHHVDAKTAPISVYYGFRSPIDYMFRAELESLKASGQLKNLHIALSESSENSLKAHRGYIQELVEQHVHMSSAKAFFICGPPAMVKGCQEVLTLMGCERRQIHVEAW